MDTAVIFRNAIV